MTLISWDWETLKVFHCNNIVIAIHHTTLEMKCMYTYTCYIPFPNSQTYSFSRTTCCNRLGRLFIFTHITGGGRPSIEIVEFPSLFWWWLWWPFSMQAFIKHQIFRIDLILVIDLKGFCPYIVVIFMKLCHFVGFWAMVIFFGLVEFCFFCLLGIFDFGTKITKAWLKPVERCWKVSGSGIEFQTEVARRGNFTCYDTGGWVDTSSIINLVPLVSPIVVYLGIILNLCLVLLVPWLIYVWYQ